MNCFSEKGQNFYMGKRKQTKAFRYRITPMGSYLPLSTERNVWNDPDRLWLSRTSSALRSNQIFALPLQQIDKHWSFSESHGGHSRGEPLSRLWQFLIKIETNANSLHFFETTHTDQFFFFLFTSQFGNIFCGCTFLLIIFPSMLQLVYVCNPVW